MKNVRSNVALIWFVFTDQDDNLIEPEKEYNFSNPLYSFYIPRIGEEFDFELIDAGVLEMFDHNPDKEEEKELEKQVKTLLNKYETNVFKVTNVRSYLGHDFVKRVYLKGKLKSKKYKTLDEVHAKGLSSQYLDLSKADIAKFTREDYEKSLGLVNRLVKIQALGSDESSIKIYHQYRGVREFLKEQKTIDRIFTNRNQKLK